MFVLRVKSSRQKVRDLVQNARVAHKWNHDIVSIPGLWVLSEMTPLGFQPTWSQSLSLLPTHKFSSSDMWNTGPFPEVYMFNAPAHSPAGSKICPPLSRIWLWALYSIGYQLLHKFWGARSCHGLLLIKGMTMAMRNGSGILEGYKNWPAGTSNTVSAVLNVYFIHNKEQSLA